jgi:hypothetical protein
VTQLSTQWEHSGPGDRRNERPNSRPDGGDLHHADFPPLAWSRSGIRHSLDDLYAWGERLAVEAIEWYMAEKRRKSSWSRTLRALALVLVTAGAVVPVAALGMGRPAVGNWGFLLLALAAGCVAYDRFFGYSSSWQRYMAAATSMRSQLIDYQAAWAKEMVAMSGREPDRTDAIRLIDFVRTFTWNINDTIRSETEAWLVEFHSRLAELESRLQQTEGGLAGRGAAHPGHAAHAAALPVHQAGRGRG